MINDYSYGKNKYSGYDDTGILKFGDGVSAGNMELKRAGNDALLIVGETKERVTLSNWYGDVQYQLTRVEFADGAVWTREQVNAMYSMYHGTDGDDTIFARSLYAPGLDASRLSLGIAMS